MIVELHGLEVFGRHGALEEEQQAGQTFFFDVTLQVEEPRADRVEETVDYRDVAARVKAVSDGQRFDLLETLAAAVAERARRALPGRSRARAGAEGASARHPRRVGRGHRRAPGSSFRRVTRAYVGLGANLGDREAMLRAALEQLAREPGVELVAVSAFRETDPVGIVDQPRFLNAAAAVDTELRPRELLARLLAIEGRLGRTRAGPRFGPRTIDLDLLLYGDEEIDEQGLTVPHPRLHERLFALEPLTELDPELVAPGLGPLAAIVARLQSP